MPTYSFDSFERSVGITLKSFSILEKIGISMQEAYEHMNHDNKDYNWMIRSILVNELCKDGVLTSKRSDDPKDTTGKFTSSHMINFISKNTGINPLTLQHSKTIMRVFLHDDTNHLLYLLEHNKVNANYVRSTYNKIYRKEGAAGLNKAILPKLAEIEALQNPTYCLAHYAEQIEADKILAEELQNKARELAKQIDSDADAITATTKKAAKKADKTKKTMAKTTDKSKEQAAPPATTSTSKTQKAEPTTKSPKTPADTTTQERIPQSPKPGHMLRTKLAKRIEALPEAHKAPIMAMLNSVVSSNDILNNMSLKQAVSLASPADIINAFDFNQLSDNADSINVNDFIDIPALISSLSTQELSKFIKPDALSKSDKYTDLVSEEKLKRSLSDQYVPNLDEIANNMAPEMKTSIEHFIALAEAK